MQFKSRLFFLIFIFFIIISCAQEKRHFEHFITAENGQLKDGDSTFRFLSFNIPNMNFVEDEMEFTKPHPFNLPTTFEIKDALESVRQIGGTVVRNYTFPVKRDIDTLNIPRFVTGPGQFDERSFVVMDTVLAVANEVGVRLILPFLNNWKWMGGVPQYAAFRNKEPNEFWTDPQLIADFKKTIEFILNRTNTVTGVKYKDDKSILCWETGNELICPYSWTNEIVGYIKSIDTNHLVMDGFHAIDGIDIHMESIEDNLVDIVSTHHYKLNPDEIIKDIDAQMNRVNGRKVYVVGEFGFLGTNAINKVSDYIIDNQKIAGGLIWSLRYHRENGGFYWHSEPLGGDLYKAFHWPGFSSGIEYNEETFMPQFREKAFSIRGLEVPELEIPKSPELLPIKKVSDISWKGSVGAKNYDVERSESKTGPWKVVGLSISDAAQAYTPLFNDIEAKVGEEYFYRIVAKNESGASQPSNVVGPVKVTCNTLIDNMENLTVMYYNKGDFRLATEKDRDFKEIMNRIEVEEESTVFYYVPGNITNCKLQTFSKNDSSSIQFEISSDGKNFDLVNADRESYYIGKGDYDYWIPSEYNLKVNSEKKNLQYLKLYISEINQLARIEIDYKTREEK